jgi:hypothetical protein
MGRAYAKGRRVRFLTLTDGTGGEMTIADVYRSWNHLRIKLRRLDVLDQYACVVEIQPKRGVALHLHVLATGRYYPKAKLGERAVECGLGPVCWIKNVERDRPEDDKRSAIYVAKDLANYVSKDAAGLAEKTNVRRRPVRFSRGWGCSLTQAQELIREEIREARDQERDPGPWVVVRQAPDGSLIPMAGEGLPRVIPPIAPVAAPEAPAKTPDERAGRQAVASEESGAGGGLAAAA